MKKGTKFFVAVIAMFLSLSMSSYAQLEPGLFGIGASYVSSAPVANVFYTLSENMEAGIGLGYSSTSQKFEVTGGSSTEQSGSYLEFQGIFRYYLSRGRDVSPFVGGVLSYMSETPVGVTDATTGFGLSVLFGGQAFLAKNFSVYGQVALGYSTSSPPESESGTYSYTYITLSGSGVGAIFYF